MSRQRRKIKPKKLVDIVIAVYGRFDLLEQCLDAIPDAVGNFDYNIIIVDNDSPEKEEADKFYESRDNIILVRNKENLGYPLACNRGAGRKQSPIILFLNSDVVFEENAIDYMVRDLDDPKIGITGAFLKFPEYAGGLLQEIRPPNTVQHIGLETTINGNFIHILVGWSVDHPKVLARRDSYAVTGAALMIRRNLWHKIGVYNPIYGGGTYEDMELCLMARELGYNIVVNTKAVGVHYTGATMEHYRIGFPLNQNRMTFLQRWGQKLTWSEFPHW